MMTLKPIEILKEQEWLSAAPVQTLMRILNEGIGRDGGAAPSSFCALFVGGCVRNALLGSPVADIDIATIYAPEQVVEILDKNNIKTIPTGIEHGTITAVVEGQPFEITTLRRDVETDGRRAIVAFTKDWQEDARRRDFTINTLLADEAGNVYDPLGSGLSDLQARRVVFVGDPSERIAEDTLRILRYFRFHALYGAGDMDHGALKACRAGADKIQTLSKERITQEFFKILTVEEPAKILRIMFDHGILQNLKAPEYSAKILAHICSFQVRYGLRGLPARLLALAGFEQENITQMQEFLLVPKLYKKDMAAISAILALANMEDEQAVKVAVYKHGRTAAAQGLMIELALDRVMNGFAPKALEIIQLWDIPTFPLSGEDLIKQGLKPGPELGEKLRSLEENWIRSGFRSH